MLEVEVKQRRMTTYSKHCGFQKVAEEVMSALRTVCWWLDSSVLHN